MNTVFLITNAGSTREYHNIPESKSHLMETDGVYTIHSLESYTGDRLRIALLRDFSIEFKKCEMSECFHVQVQLDDKVDDILTIKSAIPFQRFKDMNIGDFECVCCN
jgi:hypothetical protein